MQNINILCICPFQVSKTHFFRTLCGLEVGFNHIIAIGNEVINDEAELTADYYTQGYSRSSRIFSKIYQVSFCCEAV
jgi:hypothetical protein